MDKRQAFRAKDFYKVNKLTNTTINRMQRVYIGE